MSTATQEMKVLLDELRRYRQASPENRPRLVEEITRRYGAERTILIGDMAGFTRRVVKEGIVHYLSLIGEMRALCRPIVEAAQGYLFKADADNVFAAFFTPEQGIQTAVEIQRAVKAMNEGCRECDRLEVELGLACGQVLAIGVEDVWGSPVNFAAKLGEDLAEAGEILAHESLEAPLRRMGYPLELRETTASRQPLRYFRVGWT